MKSYPLYDGHGNMVATLATNGTAFTLGNQRSFGAWGEVRQGASTGDPKSRYCANLGHKHDDESGLIYMRARYYEPASGRFLSEDRLRQGQNVYLYCADNPISCADGSGEWYDISQLLSNAWETFRDCPQWGFGSITTVLALRKIQEQLLEAVDWYRGSASRLMTQSEIDADSASLRGGNAAMIQARIAELEADLAGKADVQAVVAQLGTGVIDVMIEMVWDEAPWDIALSE